MSLFHLLASACTRLVPNLLRADPVAQGPRRLPKGEVARYPPGPKSQPEGPLRAPGMESSGSLADLASRTRDPDTPHVETTGIPTPQISRPPGSETLGTPRSTSFDPFFGPLFTVRTRGQHTPQPPDILGVREGNIGYRPLRVWGRRLSRCSGVLLGGGQRTPKSTQKGQIWTPRGTTLLGWLATLGRHSRRGFIRWRSAPPLTHRA